MPYTDPSSLTWAFEEFPSSAKMNNATNDQFLALFPDGATSVDWDPPLKAVTTDPSVSVDGARYRIGAIEFLWARYVFSDIATPYGSGIYFVTLPNAAVGVNASTTAGSGQHVGSWQARDSSGPQQSSGEVILRAADQIQFNTAQTSLVDNDSPWIWAAFDVLSFSVRIPIA
jgi:hypothetical protein